MLFRVTDEVGQTEVQDIVTRDDEQIVLKVSLVHGELNIADGTEAGFVCAGAVVHHSDGKGMTICPGLEVMRELMVADHNEFIHFTALVNVFQQPVEDRLVLNLQERLREILCERV